MPNGRTANGLSLALESGRGKPKPIPPFCLSTELDPCYFLALAHEHNAKCRFRDGILTVATEDAKWQVDANSGRLIEWRAVVGNARSPEPDMRITWEKNGLENRVRQIQAAAKASPNDFNPEYPIGSFLTFACREKALWEKFGLDAKGIRAMHLASYAFEAGLLNPLEESREDDGEEEEPDDFSIPADLKSLEGLSPEENLVSKEFWSRVAVRSADEVLPRNSWPWTVWRETALALGGNGKYADEELAKLCASPNSGPICFLLVATMLNEVRPEAAARVARLGIERLSLDDFRNDYRVLFDGRYMAGKCVLHLAKVLQNMDEAGVAAIGESLTRQQRTFLRRMVEVLRRERGKPIEKAFAAALDETWEGGLREVVKQRLEDLLPRSY
jgi:hypothetical protein